MAIGDLSLKDKEVLANYAEEAKHILEFGVGCSTQILRKYSEGKLTSLDTSAEWIELTKKNLKGLKIEGDVEFHNYDTFVNAYNDKKYDLIFVDGVDDKRLPFAMMYWDNLEPGGYMLFHDQRRQVDVDNVCAFYSCNFREIGEIYTCELNSNITVIQKRKQLINYSNWNHDEGREDWEVGYGEPKYEFYDKVGVGITRTVNEADRKNNIGHLNSIDRDWFQYTHSDGISGNWVGVPQAKNNCIKKLYDEGCRYFFLFDSDISTLKSGWEDYIIRWHLATGNHHCAYNSAKHHRITKVHDDKYGTTEWENGGGTMMFFTREVVEKVGYMNTAYGKGYFEHAGYSNRIFRAGLTNGYGQYVSPSGLDNYFMSNDYERLGTKSNFTQEDADELLPKNMKLFSEETLSDKLYYPFEQ